METLPAWEVYNPRDIAYSMARYDILIRDYLSGDDPQIRPKASRLGIDTSRCMLVIAQNRFAPSRDA